MRDDDFEWDARKAASNLADHDVSFELARDAFSDPFAVEMDDDRENYDEDRFVLIGFAGGRLLHVTYTVRGHRHRIISARGAEPHEQRRYHEERR